MSPHSTRTRAPAVAGQFYPGRANDLAGIVDDELTSAAGRLARALRQPPLTQPKALIVPHAGYIYSAPIAASAYARLLPWRDTITRVVLLGPAHRVHVSSMAASSAEAWVTPLGAVPLDRDALAQILSMPGVVVDDEAHAPEHSLEVHLPFLQRVLGEGWTLLPLVVGAAPRQQIADVLDSLWGGDETLIVISTDLSHYHDHATAQQLDRDTAAAIVARDAEALAPARACGAYPVRGMLTAADRHDLDVELLDLRNSGDTAGPADRVVGYGAFVLTPRAAPFGGEVVADSLAATVSATVSATATGSATATAAGVGADQPPEGEPFTADERATLLGVAEEAIRARLEGRAPARPSRGTINGVLRQPGAAFVTLRDGERLLGCIGTLEPNRPLIEDVADNAVAAAFRDPRMPALTADEFRDMSMHISVLTPAVSMAVDSLDELVLAVRPFIDGVLIEAGRHRATYLPSVWEQLPDRRDFLDHLWQKAGLRPGTWPAGLHVARYQTVEFGDEGPRRPINA
jgi:AmmeMemoRadiSam system protein B/AmmeMemoRadiSam system protein A